MTESPWAIPLSDLRVDDEIARAAETAVRSGWWSMGPRVAELEAAFAEYLGVRHAVALSSGTAALHLALLAVGCGPGDEVVLPSLTFVAAANAVAHTGATPVFCDVVGEHDLNLDPRDLEAAVGPATKALVVLHYGGHPCDMEAVAEAARRHGLAVVEDAAHAPGGIWRGRRCGAIGAAGCFSFFSNKNLPVGEGGLLATDDDGLAERVRLLRSHGMTTLTWDRHRGHAPSYDVVLRGFNYRLDEVRAAIALVQLRRLEDENRARARLVERYRQRLHGRGGLSMPFAQARPGTRSSHHLAVVLLPVGVDRAAVRRALDAARIQTSVHYPPVHRFSAFSEGGGRPLPRTEALAERLLTLPLYGHMGEERVDRVCEALLRAL